MDTVVRVSSKAPLLPLKFSFKILDDPLFRSFKGFRCRLQVSKNQVPLVLESCANVDPEKLVQFVTSDKTSYRRKRN